MKPVIIVGAGWSGAVVAHTLTEAGVPVEVLERARVIGGHSRMETICGVVYEPNGPHLLHTNNERVAHFFEELDLGRAPYRFQPRTEIDVGDGELRMMSWPIQVDELEKLPDWPRIEREVAALPPEPSGADFESYAVSLMGRRLYELFVEGYTRKQWGCEPSALSSSFAPKRIDLRRDGCRDLFRDAWQAFPPGGVTDAIESLLKRTAITCGADVTATDLVGTDASAIVVTAACDDFGGTSDALAWRGVHLRSRYVPLDWRHHDSEEKVTDAYVINRPHMGVPYTRTIETKHATGQWAYGTVVSEEYPGADLKHYPVADLYGKHAKVNDYLQAEIRTMLAPVPVFFCGRLATYRYINQDEAIADAWACADNVLGAVLA